MTECPYFKVDGYGERQYASRHHPRNALVVAAAAIGGMIVCTDDGEVWQVSTPADVAELWRKLGSRRRYRDRRGQMRKGGLEWAVNSVVPLRSLLTTAGATEFTAERSNGRMVKLRHSAGAMVRPLPVRQGGDPLGRAAEWFSLLRWLHEHLVRTDTTLATMSWNLWRTTLPPRKPVLFFAPPEGLAEGAFFGGRQEAREGAYTDMTYHDLSSAYPAAMSSAPMGCSLKGIDVTDHRKHENGLARAEVIVSHHSEWGPLPMRLHPHVIMYGTGASEGVWTLRELRMAEGMGHFVRYHEAWRQVAERPIFAGEWEELCTEARQFGPSGKALLNTLWGRFAMRSARQDQVMWADFLGHEPKVTPKGMSSPPRHMLFVAAEITARVRERLWQDGLSNISGTIYCDTDGFIAPRGSGPERSSMLPEPGVWRVKHDMDRVEIRAPQVYRWTGREDKDWSYITSGMPPDLAYRYFRRMEGHPYERRPAQPPLPGGPLTLWKMPIDRAMRLFRADHPDLVPEEAAL